FAKTSEKDTSTSADVAAKNDAKKALIAIMREFYNRYVIGSPTMTNEQRKTYEYPVRDTEPTPVPVPVDGPDVEIDFSHSGAHFILFGKYNTGGKITRGLPKGAHGVEIRRLIQDGDAPLIEPEPNAMEQLTLASKSPHEVVYDRASKGLKVYYVLRYFNDKGEHSLWSKTAVAIVN
ncbi:MAG: hypothetical protein LBO06_06440, partial [Bacteroidales bacterium]|nr:hypothetical protein [Bacteroidales bacterium]